MNTKDLIEAVKFQVSVKPQDEFMREVAEWLETLYNANLKLSTDYDAVCKELKQYQKLAPIGCPACCRGCFSNDKFCPHCGTSLRNNNATAEETSVTEMADNDMIKYLRDHGLTNGCSLGHHSGKNDLIADRMLELLETNRDLKEEINRLNAEIDRLRKEKEQIEVSGSETIHGLCAEIRTLKKTNDSYREECDKLLSLIPKLRVESAKEVAERLKPLVDDGYVVDIIDSLVKEMGGDKE